MRLQRGTSQLEAQAEVEWECDDDVADCFAVSLQSLETAVFDQSVQQRAVFECREVMATSTAEKQNQEASLCWHRISRQH